MKLNKLTIDSYRHLQNLNFNFTYPEGHVNAGKPLEKACIIGQSATGKTSILELIKSNILRLSSMEILNGNFLLPSYKLDFNGELEYLYNDDILKITTNNVIKNKRIFQKVSEDIGGGTVENFFSTDLKLLYLSTELISKEAISVFSRNPVDLLNDTTRKVSELRRKHNHTNYVYEFTQNVNIDIWLSLLYEVLDYRKRFTQLASELINRGILGDANRLNREYAKWSKENKNPLVAFGEKLNPIIERLNLEIDLINTEYPIPIKQKNKDEVIPISDLSTGTKGLLLSMFPLYELDTSDAIILIDEPERSLFPDIQIDLLLHYQNLAPNAQIIVATHSPFIAAAFEPEERFILYFDKDGNVAVRKGESPIGDDPNDILRNDFNVDYYNDFGKRAYQKYLDLKTKLAEETEPARKKELVVELAELGDKYNF